MSLFAELKRRNVIRVAITYGVIAWVLMQIGDMLFSTLEIGPQAAKILFAMLLLGFIPSVIFAWAFEITPEGIKKEKDITRDESITNLTAKKLNMVTIGLLVVAIILFASDRISPRESPAKDVTGITQADSLDSKSSVDSIDSSANDSSNLLKIVSEHSIAVLPFVNMSSDNEQEYFSDGITEEILNALAKIKQLKVAGRTSSFSFKGKNQDLRLIGEALGVAHILEGSVRKAGNQVRITAQLIKADDGFHMWSETYDGSLVNVFDLQENISRQVSKELKIVLNIQDDSRLASKMTGNAKAYDLFLRGREYVRKRIDDNVPKGIVLLEQAVALDSNFAEAWAILAEAEAVSFGYFSVDSQAALKRARAHIEKAIAIDPSLELPYAIRGLIKGNVVDQDYLGSINDLERALALDPQNALTLRWLGNYYQILGYFDKASPLLERAFALEPLSRTDAYNLASNKLVKGELEEARRLYEKSNLLAERLSNDIIAYILHTQGKSQAAIDFFMKLHSSVQKFFGSDLIISTDEAKLFARAAFGGDKASKLAIQKTGKIVDNGADVQWKIPGHLALENYDRVYLMLDEHPHFFSSFSSDYMWFQLPNHITFRRDPRFALMLERFGIPKVWREKGWPDICAPNIGTDGSNAQFTCH